MEQGQSLANWMILLRNVRILEKFFGLSLSFTKRGKSLAHLSSFRSTGIQVYDMVGWNFENIHFFYQSQYHRTIECLVERVVKDQDFVVPAYACTLMVRKEFRRSWQEEIWCSWVGKFFFAYSGPVIISRSSLNSSWPYNEEWRYDWSLYKRGSSEPEPH